MNLELDHPGAGECRGCGATIYWLRTPAGKNMPVNVDNLTVNDRRYDKARHVSHFATCPKAKKFSGKGKQKATGRTRNPMDTHRDNVVRTLSENLRKLEEVVRKLAVRVATLEAGSPAPQPTLAAVDDTKAPWEE